MTSVFEAQDDKRLFIRPDGMTTFEEIEKSSGVGVWL
jgi:hypothetical protein